MRDVDYGEPPVAKIQAARWFAMKTATIGPPMDQCSPHPLDSEPVGRQLEPSGNGQASLNDETCYLSKSDPTNALIYWSRGGIQAAGFRRTADARDRSSCG